MSSMSMEVDVRTSFGKGPNRRLRAAGKVPVVLYGDGKETVALSANPKELVHIIRSHGGVNTIFELKIGDSGKPENVMITDYQLEPVHHQLLHADLLRIAMDQELTLTVSIELIGTAAGVKTGGGTLDFVTRAIEVSCLPKDIPETITIDVTALEIGDYLRADELEMPEGVTRISDPAAVIAHILAPKAEVEEETPEEEGAEGAEGAEGGESTESSEEGSAKE